MTTKSKATWPPEEVSEQYVATLSELLTKQRIKADNREVITSILLHAFWEAYYLGMATERGQFAKAIFDMVNKQAGNLPYYKANVVTALRRVTGDRDTIWKVDV